MNSQKLVNQNLCALQILKNYTVNKTLPDFFPNILILRPSGLDLKSIRIATFSIPKLKPKSK